MNEFLGISIVGAALSGVIQVLKIKLGTTSWATKLLTVGLAVIVGAAYVLLSGTPIWTTILGILAAASTVYALLLK